MTDRQYELSLSVKVTSLVFTTTQKSTNTTAISLPESTYINSGLWTDRAYESIAWKIATVIW